MLIRMNKKGEISIPIKLRKELRLFNGSKVSITRIGNGILLAPKPSNFELCSARFSKAAKWKGISLDDLLEDLRKNRGRGKS